MRKTVLSVAIVVGGLLASGASAMPMAQPGTPNSSKIENVDYACGRGYHLSPRGFCRPNGPPREYRDRWDRRDRWEARRQWRERQARREWRERRAWEEERRWGGYDYRDYRW